MVGKNTVLPEEASQTLWHELGRSKACCEESAESIVPVNSLPGRDETNQQEIKLTPELRKTEKPRWLRGEKQRTESVGISLASSGNGRDEKGILLNNNGEQTVTLEAVLEAGNMLKAYQRVIANKGSAGVDGMEVTQLWDWCCNHRGAITEAVKSGKYKPQAVLRVLIPKEEKGKFRPLGIPTVIDRFVQQMVAQVLSTHYEKQFSESSHGFRPNRSCQAAIQQCLSYANEGCQWVVDLDLAKFFDTVNHSKLLQVLSEQVKDGRVISLISKFLRAPVREGRTETINEVGTPQGGVISPVLANVLLNELDRELEARGHRFVRYADDMMILCRSKKAAERTLKAIRPFIEKKLFLKINEEKTKVCAITDASLRFLGFGFFATENRKTGNICVKVRPHKKSCEKFKKALKEATRRNRGQSLESFKKRLKEIVQGWVGYFRNSSMKTFVDDISRWLRRRIRQIHWKQWKRTRTKFSALVKLGISREKAWEWVSTRKSYWRIAGSWVLATTLTNKFLWSKGWVTPDRVYRKLSGSDW